MSSSRRLDYKYIDIWEGHGIQLAACMHLDDLDFEDDLALLPHKQQKKSDEDNEYSRYLYSNRPQHTQWKKQDPQREHQPNHT